MGEYRNSLLGLGATTRQIDPAVPGVITASGTAAGTLATGIADIWRASRGEPRTSAEGDAGAAAYTPAVSSPFWETTGGKVVIFGSIGVALLTVALILIPKKKAAVAPAANRRRRYNRKRTHYEAIEALEAWKPGFFSRDFFVLPREDVDRLVAWAKATRYQKSRGAPGSRGRMYYQYLQRLASR